MAHTTKIIGVHEKFQQIFDIINHLKRTQHVDFDKIIEKQIWQETCVTKKYQSIEHSHS